MDRGGPRRLATVRRRRAPSVPRRRGCPRRTFRRSPVRPCRPAGSSAARKLQHRVVRPSLLRQGCGATRSGRRYAAASPDRRQSPSCPANLSPIYCTLAGENGLRARGSSVNEILTEAVTGPSVWRGDELADSDSWIIRFTEQDFADFERALTHVSGKSADDLSGIRIEDFPLPHFERRIEEIVEKLEHGLGLVLLRGLPIYDRFSVEEATVIYWGIGRHMGRLVPQNRKGDLLGHIRDLGRRGPYERAYATNEDLGFHTDSTDFVGLMCLRP